MNTKILDLDLDLDSSHWLESMEVTHALVAHGRQRRVGHHDQQTTKEHVENNGGRDWKGAGGLEMGGENKGLTLSFPMQASSGVTGYIHVQQKAPEGYDRHTHTHTIPSLYDDGVRQ